MPRAAVDGSAGLRRRGGRKAFAGIGWKWGGDYHSLKDFMHFSATGG